MANPHSCHPRPRRPGHERVPPRPAAAPAPGLVARCLQAMAYAVAARSIGQIVTVCAAIPRPRVALSLGGCRGRMD